MTGRPAVSTACPESTATVVCRYFDRETDEAFVYSSWRNSAYYLANGELPDAATFFSEQTRLIRETLKHATVRIACLEDSPLFIVGYVVSTGSHLDWIYVKADYRGKGIGEMLMPPGIKTATARATRIGARIAKKKNIPLKENEDGERDERRDEGSGE